MSLENLIFLLIIVVLPLINWIGGLLKEREAERQRTARPGAPAAGRRGVPQEPPVAGRPPRRPQATGAPTPRPAAVTPSTARPTDMPRPAPTRPAPTRPAPTVAVPARRRRITLHGTAALRRAVIERTVLGPCRANSPFAGQ